MFKQIRLIHEETGKNRFVMFFDMIYCILRYGVGYMDYHVFGFARIRGKNRQTFMTMNDNLSISHRLNSRECFPNFDDKIKFNENFREFIGRDFIDLRKTDAEGLKKFCEGKNNVFAKHVNDFGGSGISREELAPDTDYNALYGRLSENKQFLVEDGLVQHEEMNKLSPSSVNTIRIVTLCHNNTPHFMYALVRMSNGSSCVDNICSGGMYTAADSEGRLKKLAYCDETGKYYTAHPYTGTVFDGFKIPMFKEAVEMCKTAARVFPECAYIGWDAAITDKGPVLVEGNTLPSYDMVQNYELLDDKQGIKPRFEQVLGKNFFK